MSTIPPGVINCPCGHRQPAASTCPYQPPYTCGGPTYCGYCRAKLPKVDEPPIEPPLSVSGWVVSPDGLHEIASTSPTVRKPPDRPINRALWHMCEIFADAIRSDSRPDREAAMEDWHLLRADCERHEQADHAKAEHDDREELLRWVAVQIKEPVPVRFDGAWLANFAQSISLAAHLSGDELLKASHILAAAAARAAKVDTDAERDKGA